MSDKGGRLETGDLVGERWQISHVLGVGDLGEVYEAYDVVQSSACAVKLLAPQVLANRASYDEFTRAAQKGSELLGSCAARIERIDVDGASGSPFVVGEKVDAPSLASQVKGAGALSLERVLAALSELAPWLDRAHAKGFVHGNLKPSNVFLLDDGGVKLTDFGASALREDAWAGPPGWCAPELFEPSAKPSPRSDLYALALLAFFALTGKHAFAAADPLDRQRLPGTARAGLRAASARAAALGAKLDLRLDRWFFVALDAKPENRFKTASDMAVSLGKQLGITVELEEMTETAAAKTANGTPANGTNGTPERHADGVAPRPMVVLDVTPPAGAVGSGIAAISLKPLLFANDLPAPKAPAPLEAPPPEAPPSEPHEPGAAAPLAPRAAALHPGAPRAETALAEAVHAEARFDPRAPANGAAAPEATPVPVGPIAERVEAFAKTVAAPEPREPQAEPIHVSQAAEPSSPVAPPATKAVTVPVSVVLAAAAAILGIGLAMLALVLWVMSERRGDEEPRRFAQASQAVPLASTQREGSREASPHAIEQPTAAAEPAAAPAEPRTAKDADANAAEAETSAAAPADGTPLPAGMASLSIECTPIACESAFCDAKRYDATKPILLRAGKHVCKGVLSGYSMKGIELSLEAGQRTTERFELLPKRDDAPAKVGKKKPCGTFINPCK